MNDVRIFNNTNLGMQVRTILNPDGSILVNTEDAARGFGSLRPLPKVAIRLYGGIQCINIYVILALQLVATMAIIVRCVQIIFQRVCFIC